MAICPLCDEIDNKTFEELPNEKFCGCNYSKGLARANRIKLDRIEKSQNNNNEQFLKSILNDLSQSDVDIEQIKDKIKKKLNIKTCSVLEL